MDELTFEKIEGYILGTLSPAERESFEAEMNADEELREEVALQQQLMTSIETESVRQLLEDIHRENFEEGEGEGEKEATVVTMQPRRSFPYMAIAASVALLLVAGWFFFLQPAGSDSLYAAYFTPATGLPTTLSYSEDTRFAEGMVAYKMEEYAEARNWWQPLLADDPANDTLNFYLGVASLADRQAEDAIGFLSEVENTSGSVYTVDAQWYLALAYLQADEVAQARAILSELSQSESDYRERSRELLEEMD